jgi:hypothetical protein
VWPDVVTIRRSSASSCSTIDTGGNRSLPRSPESIPPKDRNHPTRTSRSTSSVMSNTSRRMLLKNNTGEGYANLPLSWALSWRLIRHLTVNTGNTSSYEGNIQNVRCYQLLTATFPQATITQGVSKILGQTSRASSSYQKKKRKVHTHISGNGRFLSLI